MTHRVAITQPYVPGYRYPLWDIVVSLLAEQGIEARVFFGGDAEQMAARRRRGDGVRADWAEQVPTRTVALARGLPKLMHRRLPAGWSEALLVTEMQATNVNAWSALIRRKPYITFGHGREYTSVPNRLAVRLESMLNRGAAHVLTYLPSGREAVLERSGIDPNRVTSFNNSTDSRRIRQAMSGLSDERTAQFRVAHGIPESAPIALVLGALNSHKRVDVLVEAAVCALERGWWLVVAGEGDQADKVRALAHATGRVTLLGQVGPDTYAPAARLARVLVNPGRIGLVAVDALAMSLPVLTMHGTRHAPEAEYLREGQTLFTTADSVSAFAQAWCDFDVPRYAGTNFPTVEAAAESISGVISRTLRSGECVAFGAQS